MPLLAGWLVRQNLAIAVHVRSNTLNRIVGRFANNLARFLAVHVLDHLPDRWVGVFFQFGPAFCRTYYHEIGYAIPAVPNHSDRVVVGPFGFIGGRGDLFFSSDGGI